jgi:alpha-galactosidase
MGIEWDPTEISADEREELRQWVELHKRFRPLLHRGEVVRADLNDPALQLDGVVSADRREALFRLSALDHTLGLPAGRVRLPGLDAQRTYRVRPLPPSLPAPDPANPPTPEWYDGGAVLSGRLLEHVGLMAPQLRADDLVILHVEEVGT